MFRIDSFATNGPRGGHSDTGTGTWPGAVTAERAMAAMLAELPAYIASALKSNQDSLPRNPQNAAQLQAKIAMLQRPTLVSEITQGGFWVEGAATSIGGTTIPILLVFPAATMRNSATQAVRWLEPALPVLETFMARPFPNTDIKVWYGFVVGMSWGGGTMFAEDRETYEGRMTSSMQPYEPVYYHEPSHAYLGHEGLTQFLEVYIFNTVHGAPPTVSSWTFTRRYTPWDSSNAGVHALLDVYQLIGPDAMASAYRAVYKIRAPYGQPLSAECQQAFVDRAPAELKSQVAAKMAKVVY
jgi:hypothetical protein